MRYHRTFGLNAEQLDELEERIEEILAEPWNKGIGRPKSLSLREAIMVTLLYERQNMIEEVIADLFGVSQGTVSDIITEFTPLIAQATEEFRPDAEEAKQVTQGWGQSKCFGLQVACCDPVSFPGGWLQAEEGQCLESGAVPAEVAAGRGVVGVAGAVEHADGGIGD